MDRLRLGVILLALFLAGMLIGSMSPPSPVEDAYRSLENKSSELREIGVLGTAAVIYLNNMVVALISIVSGLLVVPPLLILVYNGMVVGYVARMAIVSEGMDPMVLLALLAPHGLLEIPVILLAVSGGIEVARSVIAKLTRRREGVLGTLRKELGLVKPIALLLLVSALIEAVITPLIAEMVMRMIGQ